MGLLCVATTVSDKGVERLAPEAVSRAQSFTRNSLDSSLPRPSPELVDSLSTPAEYSEKKWSSADRRSLTSKGTVGTRDRVARKRAFSSAAGGNNEGDLCVSVKGSGIQLAVRFLALALRDLK